VVKFPCGTIREITFEQLQEYAADFPWLDGFPKLRDGTSRVVWRCVVTISPVFVLGRVGEFGASMSQWAGMRQHLKDYQPNQPDIDNHTLLIPTSRRKRGASVMLVAAVSAVEVDAGGTHSRHNLAQAISDAQHGIAWRGLAFVWQHLRPCS
jgi:hypothetical protein